MSLPIIVHTNRWRDGSIIAVSSEAAQFPAEYTQDDSPQLFWRSLIKNVEITIDCDLGAAHEYDFIVLLNHNLTSAADIIVYGADDAAFTDDVVHDHLAFNGNNLYAILLAAQTKRYVRISLLNTTNPSTYLQIGTIVVGKGNALNRSPGVPDQDGLQNETEIEKSPSAQLFTVQEQPSLFVKGLPFIGLNDASATIVKELIGACGSHMAWVLCLDSTVPNTNSYWIRLTGQKILERKHINYWNWPCEIEEII